MRYYTAIYDVSENISGAMYESGTVVLNYETGCYVYESEEVVAIGTGTTGALFLILTSGQLVTHNCATDRLMSQHVPLEKFFVGPSSGNELVAAWNNFKQTGERP